MVENDRLVAEDSRSKGCWGRENRGLDYSPRSILVTAEQGRYMTSYKSRFQGRAQILFLRIGGGATSKKTAAPWGLNVTSQADFPGRKQGMGGKGGSFGQ